MSKQYNLPEDFHVLALTVDMPNNELKGVIAQVAPRVLEAQFGAILTLSGFDDDPREIYEIPECVNFLKRASDIGLISVLEVSSSLDGVARVPQPAPGFGAFEVWAFGNRKIVPGKEFDQSIMREFLAELDKANRKCEAILKDRQKWAKKATSYLIRPGKKSDVPEGQHRHGNPTWN